MIAIALASSVYVGCATPRPALEPRAELEVSAAETSPWSASVTAPVVEHQAPVEWEDVRQGSSSAGLYSNMIELGYRFYSNHLTKVDGPRCEHRPTCSRYSMEAIRKHGAIVGAWMTVDRLYRGSHSSSLRSLPILKYYQGRPYFSDPIEENDFFF